MPLTFGEPFPGLIEASASVISIFRLITFLTLATKYGVHSQREEGGQRERVRCLHLLSDKHVTTLHKFVANASNKEYFEKKREDILRSRAVYVSFKKECCNTAVRSLGMYYVVSRYLGVLLRCIKPFPSLLFLHF